MSNSSIFKKTKFTVAVYSIARAYGIGAYYVENSLRQAMGQYGLTADKCGYEKLLELWERDCCFREDFEEIGLAA